MSELFSEINEINCRSDKLSTERAVSGICPLVLTKNFCLLVALVASMYIIENGEKIFLDYHLF